MNRKRVFPLLAAVAAVFCCAACGEPSHQAEAIGQAVVAYSDYYIEVSDLTRQVREQFTAGSASADAVTYQIVARVPDYTAFDLGRITFSAPEPDFENADIDEYMADARLALRKELETYALENNVETTVEIPVEFEVVRGAGSWNAILTSTSRMTVSDTVDAMIDQLLSSYPDISENADRISVAQAKDSLFADVFGGGDYAALAAVGDVERQDGGTYRMTLSYPDPAEVYGALGEAYVTSFNQPFFGEPAVVSLTADDLRSIDTSGMRTVESDAVVSLDEATGECTLVDASDIAGRIAAAKADAEQSASEQVNAAWFVAAQDIPSSGAILEGKSTGNKIIFIASADYGDYFYVRFYKLTGDDVTEEGTLQLGVFIQGGHRASFNLPSGYYRVSCEIGSTWYGLDYRFGQDGSTLSGDNAVRSRSGYINTISFG